MLARQLSRIKRKHGNFNLRKLSAQIKYSDPMIGSEISNLYNLLLDQVPTTNSIPCNFTSQVVDKWVQPSRLALRCINQDTGFLENITYEYLVEKSYEIANFFRQAGLKKGDAVTLIVEQDPVWWYSLAEPTLIGFLFDKTPHFIYFSHLHQFNPNVIAS